MIATAITAKHWYRGTTNGRRFSTATTSTFHDSGTDAADADGGRWW